MTLKEKGMQLVIDAQEDLIRELASELTKLRRRNLALKTNMQVLVGLPASKTAAAIRMDHAGSNACGELMVSSN
jgi:hypothetical protein